MLHTNSKKARENTRKYILSYFTPEGYDDAPVPQENGEFTVEQFPIIAKFIYDVMKVEKPNYNFAGQRIYRNDYSRFVDWMSGLPSVLNACYKYNRSASDDIADILEETVEEANQYTEEKAEQLLDKMIYNELMRGVAENL